MSRDIDVSLTGSAVLDSQSSSDQEKYCQHLSTARDYVNICQFLIGLGILLILAFTKRRVNVCRGCCDGRPGLVVPINVLLPQYRMVYALIFGLMSNTFLSLVITPQLSICGSGGFNVGTTICKTVVDPVFVAILVCLLYAPLFVCVDPPHLPLLGHLIGFLYTCIIAIDFGFVLRSTFEKCGGEVDTGLLWAGIMADLPVFVFLLALFAWFLFKAIIDIVNLSGTPSQTSKSYHMNYVKCLFARGKTSVQCGGLVDHLKVIWPYDKGFKYPLKFLGAMVVAITIMFKLTYTALYLAAFYDRRLKPGLESIGKNLSIDTHVLDALDGTLIVAPFVSSGLCLLLILDMARSLHIHMKLMARGKFKIKVNPSIHFWKLRASLKYFGYQIGFFVWAWLIYYGVTLFIGVLGIIGFEFFEEVTVSIIVTALVAVVWLGVVSGIGALCCKFFFLDKMAPGARILSVTNRNVFSWFSFFFFVYGSILGIVGATLRLLLSALFGILLLFRLDRNIMMAGFECTDWGHSSYIGFLYVEHTYNNPVVHAFVTLLTGSQPSPHQPPQNYGTEKMAFGVQQPESETIPLVSGMKTSVINNMRQVRTRWLVAYTLLHNPSIRPLRALQLLEQRKEVLRRDEEEKKTVAPNFDAPNASSEDDPVGNSIGTFTVKEKKMSCEALELSYRLFVFLMSVMAIVILVVLSFTTRRKNLCLDCCGGRPGLFAPVDLLHRSPHRLAYAAIFGVMANLFLSFALLGADKHCTSGDSYGQAICSVVLSKALVVAWLCLLYGPLFACVDTPKPLLGHIMGLLYLLFLILTLELDNGYYIYSGCDGMEYDKAETAINVLSNLPSYVFYVILLVWFGYQIVNDVFIKKTGRGILFTHRKYGHLFKYTRTLLKKKEPIKQGRWQQLKSFFWVYDKDFRFPLKFLAPLVVMMSITFKLFFIVVRVSYIAVSQVDAWKSLHPDINELWYDAGLMAITGISAVATIGGIMSVLFCLLLLFQMMATVHKDLQLAAQGKFKFYSRKPPSHTDILVSSLKYGGYQIGYFVWAWLIFWIVSVVFGLVAVAVIIGLMLFPTYVGPSLFKLFLTVVWLPVVLIVHKVMCKFVFLESGSGGKFLSITNRNALNWFSYFVFFYNAIVGFFGAIIRVLLSLLFGTLLLFRLDQNVMMDGFHFADRGNKIYRGFLYLEHTYNNPVANTFVALLLDRKEGPLSFKAPIQNQRIRNRWLVAYTLLHNPSLCPLTGTQLREQQSKETQTEGNLYEESLATPLLIN